MKLTIEQGKAIKRFKRGKNVRVVAYAGAGKTSTLTAMAKADKTSSGIYMAFNKRIAEEAADKFPFTVQCKTAHGLAFRSQRSIYEAEKMVNWPKLREIVIPDLCGSMPNTREIIANTLRRFMMSRSSRIATRHVPNLSKMGYEQGDAARITHGAVKETTKVWQMMADPRSKIGLSHDGYLKLWQLSKPELHTDVLYVDEAQDLNPVLIDVINQQRCQIVAVGDPYQQIYEWRGAVDALEELEGDVCRLTESFRFGEGIAAAGNRILRLLGETVPLRGQQSIADRVFYYESSLEGPSKDAKAVLCRSNAGVIENLIGLLSQGREVFVAGGVQQLVLLVEDAKRLQLGQPAQPGELMGFVNWKEVQDFSDTTEGSGLKVFVRLVDQFGVDGLLGALRKVESSPSPHCVTISTAHKGKGLEWDSVRISADFFLPGEAKEVTMAQLRLMYVAMTRAKKKLFLPEGILRQYEEAECTQSY